MFKTADEKKPAPGYPKRPVIFTKPDPERYRLPAYDPMSPCPACHFGHATVKYVERNVDTGWGLTQEWPWPRLARTCSQCGNFWYEEPCNMPEDRYGACVQMLATNDHNRRVRIWARF